MEEPSRKFSFVVRRMYGVIACKLFFGLVLCIFYSFGSWNLEVDIIVPLDPWIVPSRSSELDTEILLSLVVCLQVSSF